MPSFLGGDEAPPAERLKRMDENPPVFVMFKGDVNLANPVCVIYSTFTVFHCHYRIS